MNPLLALLVPLARADTCSDYETPLETGRLEGTAIVEASGLAPSPSRAGVWYTHNDAGGKAEIHAFQMDGTFVETHAVPDASFWDWEDLSGGPCPAAVGGWCLYVGDVGDNNSQRMTVQVYAVAEPSPGEDGRVVASWDVAYPDAPHDCEAIFVHPHTGRVYLVSKEHEETPAALFALPVDAPSGPVTATQVASLDFKTWLGDLGNAMATGADWDPTGERVVIRTYSHAFEWHTDPCDPDAHWADTPFTFWPTFDKGGESIAYDHTGGMTIIDEGDPALVLQVACEGTWTTGGGPCPDDTDPDTDGDDTDPDTDGDDTDPNGKNDGACGCAAPGLPTGLPGLLAAAALATRRNRRRWHGSDGAAPPAPGSRAG